MNLLNIPPMLSKIIAFLRIHHSPLTNHHSQRGFTPLVIIVAVALVAIAVAALSAIPLTVAGLNTININKGSNNLTLSNLDRQVLGETTNNKDGSTYCRYDDWCNNNVCVKNKCYTGGPGDPCEKDSDCPAAQNRCVQDICRTGEDGDRCEKESDCSSGVCGLQFNSFGPGEAACKPKQKLGQVCVKDSHCETGVCGGSSWWNPFDHKTCQPTTTNSPTPTATKTPTPTPKGTSTGPTAIPAPKTCPVDSKDYTEAPNCGQLGFDNSKFYTGSSGGNRCCWVGFSSSIEIRPSTPTNAPTPTPVGTGGGGGNVQPPAAPIPTIPPEVGYCANASRENALPGINGATCDIKNPNAAAWKERNTTNPEGHDAYCKHIGGNQADYFYECLSAGAPTPTATPTPYTPQPIGGDCNPLQGTWQCQGGGYCSQACTSSSASCTVGKCCTYGASWNGTACVADPTPTQPPAASTPPATPTPISTGDACPDVNPGTNPPVFNVCRPSAPGCLTAEGETPKASSGAHDTCSSFYGGSYLCCQRAPATGVAGSSCNKTPIRTCDTSGNTSTGSNIQCTGCGGYCVPDSSGSSVGRCMNQYY